MKPKRRLYFMACASCTKVDPPALCCGCLHNRSVIEIQTATISSLTHSRRHLQGIVNQVALAAMRNQKTETVVQAVQRLANK